MDLLPIMTQKKRIKSWVRFKRGYQRYTTDFCKDILKGLSNNTRNLIFNKALDEADELQKQSDLPYVESFFSSFD